MSEKLFLCIVFVLTFVLIIHGWNVRRADEADLISAAVSGDLRIVKSLIEAGADVNLQTKDGSTALSEAVRYNNIEVVEALLAAGAEVNSIESEQGETILALAANYRNREMVEKILNKGADINYAVIMQIEPSNLGKIVWSIENSDIEKKIIDPLIDSIDRSIIGRDNKKLLEQIEYAEWFNDNSKFKIGDSKIKKHKEMYEILSLLANADNDIEKSKYSKASNKVLGAVDLVGKVDEIPEEYKKTIDDWCDQILSKLEKRFARVQREKERLKQKKREEQQRENIEVREIKSYLEVVSGQIFGPLVQNINFVSEFLSNPAVYTKLARGGTMPPINKIVRIIQGEIRKARRIRPPTKLRGLHRRYMNGLEKYDKVIREINRGNYSQARIFFEQSRGIMGPVGNEVAEKHFKYFE